MKKIGQKFSFLTKILLVVGLLISNLSSLSVVFAYEAPEDVVISLNEETLEINYTEKLAEEVETVDVKVYENYTYSDGQSENEVLNEYSLTAEELLAAKEGTLELTYDSIFVNDGENVNNYELFDGTYEVKVEIVDVTDYSEEVVEEVTETSVSETETTEVQTTETEDMLTGEEVVTETILAYGTYEKEITHDSGLNIKLYDSNGNEIVKVNGQYPVSLEDSKVTVVAQILSGGLNPTDLFKYEDAEYMASELVGLEFSSQTDFSGYLFGEYELPVEVKVLKQVVAETSEVQENTLVEEVAEDSYEEVVYSDSVKVLYESYELNAAVLNVGAVYEGYGEAYLFYGEDKDGVLYVLSELEDASDESVVTRTMLDLYNMLNAATESENEGEEPIVTYSLLKDGVNVLESYVLASEEDTIESYLATVALDDTVQVVLSNDGLTITYKVVWVGDLNNDKALTEEDVLTLIDQVVGESKIDNIDKSDLYGFDGEVNSLDVLYLNQVVKTKVWDATIEESEVTLNASLDVKANGEALSEENYLTSGDEFTVDYVLSLTDYEVNGVAGLFDYDKSLFELVSVKVANDWLGNDENGKFLYLGEESLTGPELEDTEVELPESSNTETTTEENPEEETVVTADYVVVTATFKALKATNEDSNNVITLEEIELFNSTDDSAVYYVLDKNTVSTDTIKVTASADNSLSYLEVAGVEIALEDGVYEYEITVDNEVINVDLKYILGNVAANVTSTVYPEELAEGSNTVVITVTSESGVSQDYTITVIREEAPEETTTQVSYDNSYNNYDDEEEDKEVVVTPEPSDEEEEEEKEENNLSRIIIIILILLVIAGLVYLIFKDEDDEETKKTNKEINKLKKEVKEPEVVTTVNKTASKPSNKANGKTSGKSNNSSKTKKTNNNKKER